MRLIAHRGNVNGSKPDRENTMKYINEALELGFDVEIDVRYNGGFFYLGHDKGDVEVDLNFLKNDKIWCHAKDIETLNILVNKDVHCFFHQNDDVTLTSKNFLWTFPDKKLTENSIALFPEKFNYKNLNECKGICSDFVVNYKNNNE